MYCLLFWIHDKTLKVEDMQISFNFAVMPLLTRCTTRRPDVHHRIRRVCAGVGKAVQPGSFFRSKSSASRYSMSYWYQTLFWEKTCLRSAAWTMKDYIRRMLVWTDGKPCSSFVFFRAHSIAAPSPVKFTCWRFQSRDPSKTPGAVPVVPPGVRLNTVQPSLAQKPSLCSVQAAELPAGSAGAETARGSRELSRRSSRGGCAGMLEPALGCWCHLPATPRPRGTAGRHLGAHLTFLLMWKAGRLRGHERADRGEQQGPKHAYTESSYVSSTCSGRSPEKKLRREDFLTPAQRAFVCSLLRHRSTHRAQPTRNFLCRETVLLKSGSVLAAGIAAGVGCGSGSVLQVRAVGGPVWAAECA